MIYLDNASTTKIDTRVLMAMFPYLTDYYGNPGNIHSIGKHSRDAIDAARSKVAKLIGAQPESIIFTSGGSEANTMVFAGIKDYLNRSGYQSVATSNAEHKSVIMAADALYNRRVIPVSRDGSVTLKNVRSVCETYPDIGMVSVMHTNNETGSVSNIREIADYCHENGILLHTDCVQAVGFHEIDVDKLCCDMLSISAHKIHGGKGVGALYIRDRHMLSPVIYGGSAQEYGLRGGTENVAGIVGFGKACEIVMNHITEDHDSMSKLCKILQNNLLRIQGEHGELMTKIHGQVDGDKRIVNVAFKGIDAETMLIMLDCMGVAVSAGAACNNNQSDPSYVLTSMGISDEEARSSIRISLSRETTDNDIYMATDIISDCIRMLKK